MKYFIVLVFISLVYYGSNGFKVNPDVKRVPPSPSASASPIPIPRTLTGKQWLAENGTLLDPNYRMGRWDQFTIEINLENPTAKTYSGFIFDFDGIMAGSMKTARAECFGIGMKSMTAQLIGMKEFEDGTGGEPEHVKTLFPIFFAGRHTYKFIYNGTDLLLYQDTSYIGRKESYGNLDDCGTESPDSAVPLTVGAGFNNTGVIEHFVNADYYWLKIYIKPQNGNLTLVGEFDFTERYYSVNNRTEFPNLVFNKTDVLYFHQYP